MIDVPRTPRKVRGGRGDDACRAGKESCKINLWCRLDLYGISLRGCGEGRSSSRTEKWSISLMESINWEDLQMTSQAGSWNGVHDAIGPLPGHGGL